MASRQTADATSSSGFDYAAGASFGNIQQDIKLAAQTTNPAYSGVITGIGTAATAAITRIPILTLSNSTSPVSGATCSGTTATLNLGSPHNLPTNFTGSIKVVGVGVGGYNGTFNVTAVPTAYSLTYTVSGGSFASSGLGFVEINTAGTSAANLAYAPAVQGATIRGATVGPMEVWSDGGLYDTTNSRTIYPSVDFPAENIGKVS